MMARFFHAMALVVLFLALAAAARADDAREAALQTIEVEAAGVVPADALSFWLFMQRQGNPSPGDAVALDPVTEATLRKLQTSRPSDDIARVLEQRSVSMLQLRALVLSYLGKVESELKAGGKVSKVKMDFVDVGKVLSAIHGSGHPVWYTTASFTPSQFVGLMALPLSIGGISEKVKNTDGYELPPVEFLFHDELHAVGMIATQQEELKRTAVHAGSAEYYEAVLQRIRYTKRFLAWVETVPDTLDRRVLRMMWFDAFRDFYPEKAPWRTYTMSEDNLNRYIGRHLSDDAVLKIFERVKYRFGKSNYNRFAPGDLFPRSEKNPEQFTFERVARNYRKFAEFAGYDAKLHGDRFWNELVRKAKGLRYACQYLLLPYEKVY